MLRNNFWSETLQSRGKNLAEIRRDLGSFLQNRARGALVRASFSLLNEMDAPT